MSLAPVRKAGPLGQLQSECDSLKIKVDEQTGITNKWSPKNAEEPQVQAAHKLCIEYKIEASSLLIRANNLQMHNEPSQPAMFDQKKADEIKRLQSLQERLNRMIDLMETLPSGDELRNTRKSLLGEDEEEDSEGEESAEEDLNEGDNDEEEEEADLYIAISKFDAEQDGDLSIALNEVVDVITKRKDDWWEAENEAGKRGLVPSNFLRPYTEEDDEEEEKEDPPNVQETKPDGEFETSPNEPDPVSPRSGKELWKGIKDVVNEPKKTDVTDVLAALGALPAGFRPSTLRNLLNSSADYSLCTSLLPVLSESQLSFCDLHWDPATNQLRKVLTRTLRSCKLWKCVMIPLAGTGVEVLSHHIRLALFDGSKVLSNIITIRAHVDPLKPKLWRFSSAKDKEGGILPTLLDGYTIIRSNSTHSNIGILFELGLTYVRNPPKRVVRFNDGVACEYSDTEDEGSRQHIRQTGEKGELSCGWTHLKLFDEQGVPIPNKTYMLHLHGGTPYEQGVAVDPSISRRATTNRFRALIAASKQPKLYVQIGMPSAEKRKYLDLLPSEIVAPIGYCDLVAMYRRVLVDALVCDRSNPTDASIVHSPVLAAFLGAIEQPDIMDAMKRNWLEKMKFLTRADKRDKENLKKVFKSVVMETAYPLLHCVALPDQRWGDHQVESTRWHTINRLMLSTKDHNGMLSHLLSGGNDVEPFDISEVTFDPLRNYGRVLN